jgi:hypothetical protein
MEQFSDPVNVEYLNKALNRISEEVLKFEKTDSWGCIKVALTFRKGRVEHMKTTSETDDKLNQ